MELSEVGGDQTSFANRSNQKLRDMENWPKQLANPTKMLSKLLEMNQKHYVNMTIQHVLIKHILKSKTDVMLLAEMIDPGYNMSEC